MWTVKNMHPGYIRLSSNFESNAQCQKTKTFKTCKKWKHYHRFHFQQNWLSSIRVYTNSDEHARTKGMFFFSHEAFQTWDKDIRMVEVKMRKRKKGSPEGKELGRWRNDLGNGHSQWLSGPFAQVHEAPSAIMGCQKLEMPDSWVSKIHLARVTESTETPSRITSFKSTISLSGLPFYNKKKKVWTLGQNKLEFKCQLNHLLCDPDLIISKRAPVSQRCSSKWTR